MKKLEYLACAILIVTTASCVGIKSEKYSAIKPEELKVLSTKKSKIFIDWGFHSTLIINNQQNVIDKGKSDQNKFFTEVIKDSNCCEIVNEKDEADIVVEGAFYNETSQVGSYFAFLSGFTFTAIPCWSNSKIRINVEAHKGKMINNYDIKDSVFIAIWGPLIIATPFSNAITVEEEVNKNLYKDLVFRMKNDGFFGK